ncbi:MAG: hypothetical protein CL694_07405 [Chloroflexi bacterium]|jgi:hypothetical protein|nr:hypothetical protein [Chloroflexota bacterium]HAL47069.1 hypothetical protein [Dehalococcoidia bacterium]
MAARLTEIVGDTTIELANELASSGSDRSAAALNPPQDSWPSQSSRRRPNVPFGMLFVIS